MSSVVFEEKNHFLAKSTYTFSPSLSIKGISPFKPASEDKPSLLEYISKALIGNSSLGPRTEQLGKSPKVSSSSGSHTRAVGIWARKLKDNGSPGPHAQAQRHKWTKDKSSSGSHARANYILARENSSLGPCAEAGGKYCNQECIDTISAVYNGDCFAKDSSSGSHARAVGSIFKQVISCTNNEQSEQKGDG